MTLKQMFQSIKSIKLEVLVKRKLIYETKSDLCISKKKGGYGKKFKIQGIKKLRKEWANQKIILRSSSVT